MTQVRVFEEKDADRTLFRDRNVAVIGYGSQGHAHAQNLQDSGVSVVVGLREGSPSRVQSRADGLRIEAIGEATQQADTVMVLIPDQDQPRVYEEEIAPNLKSDATLMFAHGFNIHYGAIDPPPGVDVSLVAPKSPGALLRTEYQAGRGVPALVAVHRDASGEAFQRALAYADAIGSTRAGVLETTFADETETDLFGEQAVLCGGVSSLIKAGFETLVEAGYAPELAYFECLHELKLIVDLIYSAGLSGMRRGVSDTAEYGDYVSGDRVVGDESRAAMKKILGEVQTGAFAKRWMEEASSGGDTFLQRRSGEETHQLEAVGRDLRSRMAWL
jgi:ketol-acid reductoisomerase